MNRQINQVTPAGGAITPGAGSQRRFAIIDALRIVLALCVTWDHVGVFPLFAGVDASTRLGQYLTKGWITVIWGVPAVIGFFVISGFCIHLPFRGEEALPVGRYYARRYLRILIPVAAAIAVCRAIGIKQPLLSADSVLWQSALWSLACEEIYYAVYPLARLVRNRFGWNWLLGPAFLLGGLLAFRYPNALDGTFSGVVKTAVILYPIWLLGCLLAEQSECLPAMDSRAAIWQWRLLAWFGSWACEMLHFHAKWSQELTMLCFGVLAYFWIRKEISFTSRARSFRLLAWAGMWSYSLYLMHGAAATMVWKLHLPDFGHFVNWVVLYAGVLGISYAFYLCIERPSHELARRIHLSKAQNRQVAAVRGKADSGAPEIIPDGIVQPQGGLT